MEYIVIARTEKSGGTNGEDGKPAAFDDDAAFGLYGAGYDNRADWRRDNINQMVKLVYDTVHAIDDECEFGISPFAIWQNDNGSNGGSATSGFEGYNSLYCDALAWIEGGYIDYISPQLYWPSYHESAPFNPLCEWWNNLGNDYGVQCYISIDIASSVEAWTNSASNYEERLNQIAQVRATSVDFNPGQVFYSAGY